MIGRLFRRRPPTTKSYAMPAAMFMAIHQPCLGSVRVPHRYAVYIEDKAERKSANAPQGSIMAKCPECGAWVWQLGY